MNIKEHIDAGHYPKDEKGRALVPLNSAETAVIAATDVAPCPNPAILGWIISDRSQGNRIAWWDLEGRCFTGERDLFPPAPRKVKVRCKLRHNGHDFVVWDLEGMPMPAWREGAVIEFTTEYEEPWS